MTNYADLISAEQRIIALTPGTEEPGEEKPVDVTANGWMAVIVIVLGVAAVAAIVLIQNKKTAPKQEAQEQAPKA